MSEASALNIILKYSPGFLLTHSIFLAVAVFYCHGFIETWVLVEDGCCCLYPHQHCTEQNLTHCFEKRGSSSDLAVVTLHAVTDSKYRSLNAEKTGVHWSRWNIREVLWREYQICFWYSLNIRRSSPEGPITACGITEKYWPIFYEWLDFHLFFSPQELTGAVTKSTQ